MGVAPMGTYQAATGTGYGGKVWDTLSGNNGAPGVPLINMDMGAFNALMPQVQANLLGAQFGGADASGINAQLAGLYGSTGQNLNSIAGQFLGVGTGANDPRFAAYEASQRNLLNSQRGNAVGGASAMLGRQGVTGTAALNDLNRINAQYDAQEQALSGGLGMQQMGRQDTALGNAANIYAQGGQLGAGLLGQQFGNTLAASQANNAATQMGLDAQNSALQNTLANPTLQVALQAAQNAGMGQGGGKK